jgi:hypothetical protein
MVWVVNATPRPLCPQERPGTHCIGGCVGLRAGLDGCGKSHSHRDSISGPSICTRQSVTVPIINFGTRMRCGEPHTPAAVLSDIWRRFGRRCSLYQRHRPSRPPLKTNPITDDANIPGGSESLLSIPYLLMIYVFVNCNWVDTRWLIRGADKSLAKPTSRCIFFDDATISLDASLVMYINSNNIPPIMIINRIYETQNLLSL